MLEIKTFYFNPYRECTYIVSRCKSDCECVVIDPGMYEQSEEKRFFDYLSHNNLTPTAALITHTHPDHICGLDRLENEYPDIKKYGCLYDMPLSSDNTVNETNMEFSVILTPGHKEDSVCFYFKEDDVLFTGDTLFQESVGRTDLPGGDMATLMDSLGKLIQLDDKTKVYPGHGYTTTIGYEKENNPFL